MIKRESIAIVDSRPSGYQVVLMSARVTIRQHRFEITAAVLACLAMGVRGLTLQLRLDGLGVPPACIAGSAPECGPGVDAWRRLVTDEGTPIVGMMAYLPFWTGLLGGVPLVAREIESGTAQIAWSLNASRARWLVRQAAPIAILLGAAIMFAAVVAADIQGDRELLGELGSEALGLHGPLVLTRALAAFGVGLLAGALLGRALPALIFGSVVALVLVVGVDMASDAWVARLEPVIITESSRTITAGWAWITPDGGQLTNDEGLALVPAEVAATDPEEEPVHSMEWLEEHGYQLLPVGVTDEMALGWAPYDGLIFGLVGVASLAATLVVVNRRSTR